MFNFKELVAIQGGVQMAVKSAQRLSNRAGQPVSVAEEYRKVIVDLEALLVKINGEIVKATPKK